MTSTNAYQRRTAPKRACEYLKLLRSGWWTFAEMEKELEWNDGTLVTWNNEMLEQGVIVRKRQRKVMEGPGSPPYFYSLAPEWGGTKQEPDERL